MHCFLLPKNFQLHWLMVLLAVFWLRLHLNVRSSRFLTITHYSGVIFVVQVVLRCFLIGFFFWSSILLCLYYFSYFFPVDTALSSLFVPLCMGIVNVFFPLCFTPIRFLPLGKAIKYFFITVLQVHTFVLLIYVFAG